MLVGEMPMADFSIPCFINRGFNEVELNRRPRKQKLTIFNDEFLRMGIGVINGWETVPSATTSTPSGPDSAASWRGW